MDGFGQRRTWQRARRLGLSQLACLGRHTVTGALCTCGRQFVDWPADYRVFSKDQWEPESLFVPVVRGVLDQLAEDQPFVAALDDTLLRKRGAKIPGVGYRRDPLSPPFHTNLVRGQRYIQLSACLAAGDHCGAARAIPIRFEHSPPVQKPRKSAPDEEWKVYRKARRAKNLSTHAAGIFQQLRRDDSLAWREITAFGAGQRHTFRVKTPAPVLWKKAGAEMPLRMVTHPITSRER